MPRVSDQLDRLAGAVVSNNCIVVVMVRKERIGFVRFQGAASVRVATWYNFNQSAAGILPTKHTLL